MCAGKQVGEAATLKTDEAPAMTGGRVKGGGIGIILLVLVGMYFGIDPSMILNSNLVDGGGSGQQSSRQTSPEEALDAASMIGDDNLQKKSRGYVVPDSFTHGSSKQRVKWIREGLKNGDIRGCNTFS